jgi:hypothetical protein
VLLLGRRCIGGAIVVGRGIAWAFPTIAVRVHEDHIVVDVVGAVAIGAVVGLVFLKEACCCG